MSNQANHEERRRTGRRQVLRAGAWAAPAVTIAAAAPAYAASVSHLKFNNFTVYGTAYVNGHPTGLEAQLAVQHVYAAGAPTPNTVVVTVSYPDTRVNGAAPTAVTGSGWTFTTASHTGGSWVYTFTYAGPVAPGGSTSPLSYRVALSNNSPGQVTMPATATAQGVFGTSTSASYTIT